MIDEFNKLKKNDALISFGTVQIISKVETFLNPQGQKEKRLYFEPKYKTRRNETLRLSIPVNSLDQTTIRLPATKSQVKAELKLLRQADFERCSINNIQVKRIVSSNQLHDLTKILKTLWEENRDEERNFTLSKKNTFRIVMKRFHQEVAYVLGITLEEALEKVTSALDIGWKHQQQLRQKQSIKQND